MQGRHVKEIEYILNLTLSLISKSQIQSQWLLLITYWTNLVIDIQSNPDFSNRLKQIGSYNIGKFENRW